MDGIVVSTLVSDEVPQERNSPLNLAIFRGITADRQTAGLLYVTTDDRVLRLSSADDARVLAGAGLTEQDDRTGVGNQAGLKQVLGVAVDAAGNVYAADTGNHRIEKISPDGVVTTLAGSTPGFADGPGPQAKFYSPTGLCVDWRGNVFVADRDNAIIRKIAPDGTVSTYAGVVGSGDKPDSYGDGPSRTARFLQPTGVAVDDDGNIFVADSGNYAIRRITPLGQVSTVASGYPQPDWEDQLGWQPTSIAIDSRRYLYVVDGQSYRILRVSPQGDVQKFAGTGFTGKRDGPGEIATFGTNSGGITVDSHGTVYVADGPSIRVIKGGQ